MTNDTIGVYAHIPYCASKCPYCDFNSVAPGAPREGAPANPGGQPDERRYVGCLLEELKFHAEGAGLKGRPLESLYVGGGTPTVFSPTALGALVAGVLGELDAAGGPSSGAEVTVEVNPGTIDATGLKGLKKAGVTRLSIGVQSFSDRALAALGRGHTAEKAVEVYGSAREAGFDNVGVDLIFGVPGQSSAEWEETLAKAIRLAPEHVSLYGLTIEERTPFGRIYGKVAPGGQGKVPAGVLTLPDEDTAVRMYSMAVESLSRAGYEHYEISNFAVAGRFSRHNTRYWLGGDYLGLGAGAHTYLLGGAAWGLRAFNEADPDAYMRSVERTGSARAGGEELTRDQALTERVMLGLRMLDKGIEGEGFRRRFGQYPEEALSGIKALEAEGLVTFRGKDILLTPRGVLLSDEVFVRIL